MSRVGETGVGEMGIGETGVGEMGVGETGPNLKGVVMSGCSRPISNISLYIILLRGNDQETAKSE